MLDGLKETYNSLEVPIGPTVRSIQLLQEVLLETIKIEEVNINDTNILIAPFQYLINSLSEKNL